MSSRISITLLICIVGAAITVGALFLPPLESATPAPAPVDATAATGPAEVSIEAFTFTQTSLLSSGQEVLVTNNDSVPHTLTADDGSFDTGLLQPGDQAVVTVPTAPGEFSFFCEVHPAMTGSFSVEA